MKKENYWGLDIPKVEEKYNAKYINDFSIHQDKPLAVFYVENPDTDLGHSNYFGIGANIISLEPEVEYQYFITNAKDILEKEYPAIELPNGELLMSLYPHDFKEIEIDGVYYMIDGGNAGYTRYSPIEINIIQVKVEKDKIFKI
jgi:hypothetical protein